jgi:hypothetical protein
MMALLACPLVCLYWVFKPPDYFWAEHKRFSAAIGLCAFLSCSAVVATGFHSYLWFIPDNLAHETHEGGVEAVRWSIAGILGFAVTCCLATILEKACREKHHEQTEAAIAWDIERNKTRLNSAASENDREKMLAAFREEKTELEKLDWQAKLTPVQERKLSVLRGLLDGLKEDAER